MKRLKAAYCVKCGCEDEANFYFGCRNLCKPCYRQRARDNREARLEYYRAFDRRRSMSPERVARRKSYEATEQGKESLRKSKAKWIANNPVKRSAQNILWEAILNGKVVKKPCEVCGATKVHAHHDDYSKPLDVKWLCPLHHKAAHTKHNRLFSSL